MCGIAGIINPNLNSIIIKERLQKMIQYLFHRGPNNQKIWINHGYGLGFCRLSILDLSENGNQPMCNEDNSIWLVCNGEIYNYKQLREKLINGGHRFTSLSDSEIILHAYEEYDINFLDYINGMFALAIIDQKKNKIILARDRLGIKPLYYSINVNEICFASELKALYYDKESDKSINRLSVNLYFIREVIPAPYTIYNEINKLCAGEYLIGNINNNKIEYEKKKYWELHFYPKNENKLDKICYELKDILIETMRMHLVSDVPIGAFLSGGIDSSGIVALMSMLSNGTVNTFTAAFNDNKADESKLARTVSEYLKTMHHEFKVEADSVALLDKLVYHFDEPFGDSSAIATYCIAEIAKKYTTVILSGDGGDELFGGYISKKAQYIINLVSLIPHIFGITVSNTHHIFKNNIKRQIQLQKLPKWLLLSSLQAHIYDMNRYTVINPEWRVSWDEILETYSHLKKRIESYEPLNMCLAGYFDSYLPDDILTKIDRTSSAHSLETRVPLLDHTLVEYCAKIPLKYKFSGKNQKYIFRKIIKPYLPDEVFLHKKHGFYVPVNRWGKTIWLKKLLEEIENNPAIGEIINIKSIGKWDGQLIWQILFFAKWLNIYTGSR